MRLFLGILAMCGVSAVIAEPIIVDADPQALVRMIEDNTMILDATAEDVHGFQRRRLADKIDRVAEKLSRIADRLSHDGGGDDCGWFQANAMECVSFCRSRGMINALSPEGAQCVSGESQALSAVGKIVYTYGTWGGGPQASISSQSNGAYCYRPGQKKDNDRTDITVGCFCRR